MKKIFEIKKTRAYKMGNYFCSRAYVIAESKDDAIHACMQGRVFNWSSDVRQDVNIYNESDTDYLRYECEDVYELDSEYLWKTIPRYQPTPAEPISKKEKKRIDKWHKEYEKELANKR